MGQGDVEYLVVSVFVSSATDNTQRSFSENLIDLLNDPSCQEITVTQTNTCEAESACNTIRSYTCSCLDKGKKQSITFCCLDRSTREVIDIRKTGELADRKVLLSVLLRGKTSIPDVEQRKSRLSSATPEAMADIKVGAAFNFKSSLCLLMVPIAVWDMVKNDEAYKFVAFVESSNLFCSSSSSDTQHAALPESLAGNIHLDKGKNGNIQ